MKIKIFIYVLCIFAIILIQSTLLDYIKIFDIKPNLLIVFVVSVALLRGNVEGAVVGFFTGLSQDIITGKLLGFYALLGLYLGFLIGSVNKRLYRENFLVIIFFTFISTVAYEWMVYFLTAFLKGKIDLLFSLRSIILPEAVYNCALSIVVYIFVIKLNDRLINLSKISRKY